jgi:hypothetical protein
MEEISYKLIYFGSNGVVVYTLVHSGVTTQIYKRTTPFMFFVHYVAYLTNLIVQTFSKQSLV